MELHNYFAYHLFRFCFLFVVVLLFTPIIGSGQTSENQVELGCRLAVDLVYVYVEVEDESGRRLSDLNKDQFVIYEDGVKQSLEFLRQQEGVAAGKTRVRYKLGYYPTNDKQDGLFRLIQIQVLTENDNKVKGLYWPIGYFATRE
jgi:hypothetical protein